MNIPLTSIVTGTRLRSTALLLTLLLPSLAPAAMLQPGNLMVSTKNRLYELTPTGTIIQSLDIPYPGATRPATETARDIVVDSSGRVHVYNGTFNPVLSTFDFALESWTHRSIPGWSTVNNGSYGGIGILGDYVFLTDMSTFGSVDSPLAGLIRYDLENSSYTRFAPAIAPIDLTIGQDGKLYALHPEGSPEGRLVDVYDPLSLMFEKQISLAEIFDHTGHRAIAADAASNMFIADFDGDLQKIDAQGNLIESTKLIRNWIGFPITASLQDIDLREDGMLAIGSRFDELFTTNGSFSEINRFRVGSGTDLFVAWVPSSPVPDGGTTMPLLALAFLTCVGSHKVLKRNGTNPTS